MRWYQAAAFYPFMRGHAHLEAKRREPWLFGEDNTARIRAAIRQRCAAFFWSFFWGVAAHLACIFLKKRALGPAPALTAPASPAPCLLCSPPPQHSLPLLF